MKKKENGLNNSVILSLFEDIHGTMWIGSEGGGVCKYTPNFETISKASGLRTHRVRALYFDRSGRLWTGSHSGDISIREGSQVVHFVQKPEDARYVISAAEDQNGNMWFTTFGHGLFRFSGENGDYDVLHFGVEDGLPVNELEKVIVDDQGHLWITSWEGGITKMDENRFSWFDSSCGLPSDIVICAYQIRSGDLWFGTYDKGAFKMSGDKLKILSTVNGLSDDIVRVIFEDHRGRIWFGTEGGGIDILDGTTIRNCRFGARSNANEVFSIIASDTGKYYVSTLDGLFELVETNDHDQDHMFKVRRIILSILIRSRIVLWLTDFFNFSLIRFLMSLDS